MQNPSSRLQMKSAWTVSVHSMMRGQEQMFYDMIKCPDKMNQALHNITETLKEFSIALIEAGDAVQSCSILYIRPRQS